MESTNVSLIKRVQVRHAQYVALGMSLSDASYTVSYLQECVTDGGFVDSIGLVYMDTRHTQYIPVCVCYTDVCV